MLTTNVPGTWGASIHFALVLDLESALSGFDEEEGQDAAVAVGARHPAWAPDWTRPDSAQS